MASEEIFIDKIIVIAIAKSSSNEIYNMIFDRCKSRYNMLRKNSSKAVTRIRYEAWFIGKDFCVSMETNQM